MSDLSIHPVYLSARAALVAPERAIPVTMYAVKKWLPRLGPERWCLVMLLRSLSLDTPRRSDGTKRITCSWRELAEWLDVHEETIASWLKHQPIPNDKPWRHIVADDEKSKHLALFIPRLRYAYETHGGKTRRTGFMLEVLMEDPVAPEDESKLQRQIEILQIQQGELGLETYRLNENVNGIKSDLPQISTLLSESKTSDLRYVNSSNPNLPTGVNPSQLGLHNVVVNREFTDLQANVKQYNSDSDSYVNSLNPDLHNHKSEESGKNVNELDILIQQLKHNSNKKPLRGIFEPTVQLTEVLLEDNHSTAMFYKVLGALYPERLDLYVAAVRVALQAAESEKGVNSGAVFVRALRDFADIAGVDLGLKRSLLDKEDGEGRQDEGWLGTEAPVSLAPTFVKPSVDEAIWAETQTMLRRQMTRATYDAVIQGTELVRRENEVYIVGVQSEMAKEWLENRLREIVQRTLSSVVGMPVKVEFKLMQSGR
jgi:hypothetical protein